MTRLPRAHERALIAHTMIDLVRSVYAGRFRKRPGAVRYLRGKADLDTLLIAADVLVGDVENRARNASDIARHLEIPRPTVIRKLALLTRAGIIERIEHGRYRTVDNVSPEALGYVDTSLAIIRRAARNR